jgi:hypothetical protein
MPMLDSADAATFMKGDISAIEPQSKTWAA